MSMRAVVGRAAVTFGALAVVSVTPVSAADIYGGTSYKDQPVLIPAPLWTGFYIGGNVGGEWRAGGNKDQVGLFTFPPVPGTIPGTTTPVALTRRSSSNGGGVIGGVQFGYNWQNLGWFGPNWVLGLEVDIDGFGSGSRNRTSTAINPATGDIATIRRNVSGSGVFGDVTGRIGYAWGSALLYGKGGFAWTTNPFSNVNETLTDSTGDILSVFSDRNNTGGALTGFTVGGGLEYMLNPHWTVKVEYLYYDFGRVNETCCVDGALATVPGTAVEVPANNFRFREDLAFHTVKVGFNYIFKPDYMPLK
jgi:outer membrane immunogenic protein